MNWGLQSEGLQIGGLQAGGLQARVQAGDYKLRQPISDLSTYSLNWSPQPGDMQAGTYRLRQPRWDLSMQSLVLKKTYREPSHINAV